MAKIVGQESPSKNTLILYRRSRKVSNAISTVVNIHSSRNHRARFALDRKIRRDNKRLGRSTSMVDDHRVSLARLIVIHSFFHSGHFYSAPSSPLPLRGAPDYSTDTVSEFHAEAHRQLQVKDLPKVPT